MKTEFNKVQGLFDAAAGNSFSLSHAKPSLRAQGSLVVGGAISDNESFKLTDASGRSLTFKVDAAVATEDGSLDADGNVIVGFSNKNDSNANRVDRLVAVINAVTSLSILAVDDGATCTLYQEVNGAGGNTAIETFDNAGDVAANLTNVTKNNFTGGKDAGTAETATGIHFLTEEIEINQTTLNANNDIVVAQLSHKLPENSVILKATMINSFVGSTIGVASGDYDLHICDTSKAVGAAQGGNSVEIAGEIEITNTSLGTTTASEIQAVGDEQFVQLVSKGDNRGEVDIVKFIVTIQYAGMGEPIKI